MRFFFRSRKFKIILVVTLVLVTMSAVFALVGGRMAPGANLLASITAPFRSALTSVSNTVSDFFTAYSDGEKLMIENAELEQEINEMRQDIVDYERIKEENEDYKKYLGIKDQHPDFQFAPATIISRDAGDPYQGFTLNKGSLAGISPHDPVITDAGLVGYISEVGLTTSRVTTILSAELSCGALDNRTNDSGVVRGEIELASQGKTRMINLSRSCSVAVGDFAVTSGEGIFPEGLLIGSVVSIGNDRYNTSIYADIKPFVDFEEIKRVMVITKFDGQGGIYPRN